MGITVSKQGDAPELEVNAGRKSALETIANDYMKKVTADRYGVDLNDEIAEDVPQSEVRSLLSPQFLSSNACFSPYAVWPQQPESGEHARAEASRSCAVSAGAANRCGERFPQASKSELFAVHASCRVNRRRR